MKLHLSIEILESDQPWRYRVDCDQLAGTPPVGRGAQSYCGGSRLDGAAWEHGNRYFDGERQMTIGIYNPQVLAYARRHGVSELQAYRAVNAREVLQERLNASRRARPGFIQKIFGVGPDWDHY